jgi:hypothetical protein
MIKSQLMESIISKRRTITDGVSQQRSYGKGYGL